MDTSRYKVLAPKNNAMSRVIKCDAKDTTFLPLTSEVLQSMEPLIKREDTPRPDAVKRETTWEYERLVAHRVIDGQDQFLVEWKQAWEDAEKLDQVDKAVKRFHQE